ncbi:MAG: hypothetical protein LUI07_05480 [Lachnospiraceae bacterium]|nr:hypothetical protein [Lachnospiraceae bacterium]
MDASVGQGHQSFLMNDKISEADIQNGRRQSVYLCRKEQLQKINGEYSGEKYGCLQKTVKQKGAVVKGNDPAMASFRLPFFFFSDGREMVA